MLITEQQRNFTRQKRIGSTVYVTKVHFKNNTAETIDDKIIRLIKNELNFAPKNDIIGLPQTGWLPERGSL